MSDGREPLKPLKRSRGRPKSNHVLDEQILTSAQYKPTNDELRKAYESWDFTDWPHRWDPTHPEWPSCADFWRKLPVKFIRIRRELCPDTGREHLQGRIILPRKFRFAQMKKVFPPWMHMAPTKCCIDLLYFYKYDSLPYTDLCPTGEIDNRHQGKRVIFKEQLAAMRAGVSLEECADMEGANVQSIRTAQILLPYVEPKRPAAPRVIEPIALSAVSTVDGQYELSNDQFWDGYDGHKIIYIDQAALRLPLHRLKLICGDMPFRVGRGRQARYDTVIIRGASRAELKHIDPNHRHCPYRDRK